jgi:hypothetical protein
VNQDDGVWGARVGGVLGVHEALLLTARRQGVLGG